MLTLYRRHTDTCPHAAKGRGYQRCSCPIYVDGDIDGHEFRRSLKTRDWGVAESRLRQIEAAPKETILAPSLAGAVKEYLAEAERLKAREATLTSSGPASSRPRMTISCTAEELWDLPKKIRHRRRSSSHQVSLGTRICETAA